MSWIKTIAYANSTGRLRRLYDRVKGPDENVDNIMLAHGLRPHSMEGHMALYKSVLHHSGNEVPKWFLEVIGVFVSLLNGCEYCVEHHFAGLQRLLKDDALATSILDSLESEKPSDSLAPRHEEALDYARVLTLAPATLGEASVLALREAGWSDGQLLEINQVVAYFNYANRTVLGLGVDMEGDVLGLSPVDSQDPDNWSHG